MYQCGVLPGGILTIVPGLPLCRATIVAINGLRINVALGFLVVPLLVFAFPYLHFAASPASEWLIEIILRQLTIGIDVLKLAAVGWHGRRVTPLLNRAEIQNSFGLTDLFFGHASAVT